MKERRNYNVLPFVDETERLQVHAPLWHSHNNHRHNISNMSGSSGSVWSAALTFVEVR